MKETEQRNKILIGVVTASIKDYCWYDFKRQLQRFQKKGLDVYIVDNSVKQVNRSGFNMKSVIPNKVSQITTAYCMNDIRKYFLAGDWDKLLILESDVFITDEALDNLIAMEGDVNNYTYPMRLERFNKYSLCVQSTIGGQSLMITPEDSQVLLNNGVVRLGEYKLGGKIVTHCGYGCTLINRNVMEAVEFKTMKSGVKYPYPDSFFHYDVNQKGFVNLLNTDYICEHRNLNNETKNAIEKSKTGLTRSQRREIERAWKKK
jgi:hypothetical protein